MPQKRGDRFERARRLGHVPIVENELVQEDLQGFKTKEVDPDEAPIEDSSVTLEDLDEFGKNPKYMLSIDGSMQEVPVNEEYPSNRIGFIQIAAVLTKLDILREQEQERFVDPSRVEDLAESMSQPIILPSSNYTVEGAENTVDSWRRHLYETFDSRKIEDKNYLEVFMDVIESDPRYIDERTVSVYRCPNPECSSDKPDITTDIYDLANCPVCGVKVYPTDSLRTHERVSESNENITAITAVMQVMEHLTLCAYLIFLAENNPDRLSKVGFVVDGRLALPDAPSWLHDPILNTIQEISGSQVAEGYSPPVIVGVVKGGQFKDHALNIKRYLPDSAHTLLELSNDYIYTYIKSGNPKRPDGTRGHTFGDREHYGWPFIYKSKSGRIFVLQLPKILEYDKHDSDEYPLMRNTLEAINSVETALYDDATIPITLAHQSASIPLKTGTRVLELFSREFTDDDSQ